MKHRHWQHQRPPWWPEGEAWPPDGPPRVWRAMRGRLFWRLGFFFLLLIMLSVAGALSVASFVLSWLGVGGSSGSLLAPSREGFIALVLVIIGLVLVGRGLRRVTLPLGDVMEAAGRVAAGDYAVRVTERGPRELRALAHAFNTMTSRLQANDEQRRNLMADVAHELRTPLTVIQGNLEGLLDGVYPRDDAHLAPILDETRVLSRLIEDLRTIALAESGALKLQTEPTDLAAMLHEVAAAFRAQADAAGVELRVEAAPDLPTLNVDPARIREVLTNLLTNALRYTPRGGTIRASAENQRLEKHVLVNIGNTGEGIAPDALPHIFDRFYKSSESRGAGLGLAIAKNLVVAHGGAIEAESELGRGTTIRFMLPCEN